MYGKVDLSTISDEWYSVGLRGAAISGMIGDIRYARRRALSTAKGLLGKPLGPFATYGRI